MNVWTVIATMLWVIPVFWLAGDFELVVDNLKHLTGRKDALVRWAAVLAILCWPITLTVEIMFGDGE